MSEHEQTVSTRGMSELTEAEPVRVDLAEWIYNRLRRQGLGRAVDDPWSDLSDGDRAFWQHEADAYRRAAEREAETCGTGFDDEPGDWDLGHGQGWLDAVHALVSACEAELGGTGLRELLAAAPNAGAALGGREALAEEAVERAAKALFALEQCDRRQREDVEGNWASRLNDADQAEYRALAVAALHAAALPA